ncbi:MAG TPA: cytosine permease [Acidimicrobiales bacterium]|nr:cytosine permease [Acidimicrobiales bacterium]
MSAAPTTVVEDGPVGVDDGTIGIEPAPAPLRRLSGIDLTVLWGDLAVGVLVLAAGALLVAPANASGLGMDPRRALWAILIGSAAGSLLLALVGVLGHDRGVPTMALLRPVLGRHGSWLASGLNVAQLLGWTAFEFWAMAQFASRVSRTVFGFSGFYLWLALMAGACTGLALLGPIRFVRVWLKRAGVWIVLGVCGYLTIYLLVKHPVGALLSQHRRGASVLVGVDLVVSQPVSWLPLVADYTRFSSGRRPALIGTWAGYAAGNTWFYGLGALLVLTAGLSDASPAGIAASVLGLSASVATGVIVLVALLGGETHEAFADIYSAAMSARNIRPTLNHRLSVVAVAVIGATVAALVTLGSYEAFLFLLGSVFVPLFAVLLADWAGSAARRRPGTEPRWRPTMLASWVVGIAFYHWLLPPGTMPAWWTRDVVGHLPSAGLHSGWGASLPCFVVTFGLALLLGAAGGRQRSRQMVRPES